MSWSSSPSADLTTQAPRSRVPNILWLEDPLAREIALTGGKNAALAALFQDLSPRGIKVPFGFVVTADAFRRHLEKAGLQPEISRILRSIKRDNHEDFSAKAATIRREILNLPLAGDLRDDLREAYHTLCHLRQVALLDVAVRSSATAEDLPEASFAGQQDTYLNVSGEDLLMEAVQKCFASLYNDRAISYRLDQGLFETQLAIAVGVEEMIRSDLGASGVMFTLDTESGFADMILINASYGLGEAIVQGIVDPDEYYVFKPSLVASPSPILRHICGQKQVKVVYSLGPEKGTMTVPVDPEDQEQWALSDADIYQLARWGLAIETFASERAKRWTPVDIEWAKDGRTGELFIIQARPETVHSVRAARAGGPSLTVYGLKERSKVLAEGIAIGEKVVSGPVKVVADVKDLGQLKKGDILVTDKTDPDWEPSMRLTSGIVTNHGGRTCHAAIVSRELGLPAVVGTRTGTSSLTDGQMVTLSCAEGAVGRVYDGALPYETRTLALDQVARPLTAVMLNVANPEEALHLAKLPNDGVGLARIEFIIAHYIRVHPMTLLAEPETLPAPIREKVAKLTRHYPDPASYFVTQLAEGIAMIGAAFYPKPVIVRFSDFKTDEYAHLLGGEIFEPIEANPMIGFRGASRYYSEQYRRGFALECQAIIKARNEMGLNNIEVMVPFCRTVEEGQRVLQEMASHGLVRGRDGLLVYMMCEVPSNVILAEEFADLFDGFSIGSNDLTQLTLGVDRDSELLATLFDERNAAVTKMIEMVIRAAHRKKKSVGICGQAPSDYPEFTAFLVRSGIDSVSLNPDVALAVRQRIHEVEGAIRAQLAAKARYRAGGESDLGATLA